MSTEREKVTSSSAKSTCWDSRPEKVTSGVPSEGTEGSGVFCFCYSRGRSQLSDCVCFPSGLRAGDEVLVVNGASVSGLDLDLMQSVFGHQRLHLLLRRPDPKEPADIWPDPGDPCRQLLLSAQTCSPGTAGMSVMAAVRVTSQLCNNQLSFHRVFAHL